jgi:alpha-glucosidase (family GH31 glycosyl hydrolase)
MSISRIPLLAVMSILTGLLAPHEASVHQRAAESTQLSAFSTRPPLTPRWAYEPWVWEDEDNNAQAVRDLVAGYKQRDIPVGAVIIDSPWQTNYNTFQFNDDYPDPAGLVTELHSQGIRVLLWATPFLNVTSDDGPGRGKASNYDEAYAAGYFVDQGRVVEWDKGKGSAIDFFNPEAVNWFYSQMDQAFSVGVDGWKVDSPEGNLPSQFQTADGVKSEREYGDAYYRALYRYVVERNPEAITMARATDSGTTYAPVEVNPAGWSGDQNPGWAGLREAFDDQVTSSQAGFSMIGPDIGGYRRGERSRQVFLRWAQLGALLPLMENGGRGEHRPWQFGAEATEIYRYYAKLHHQLVPYFYSAGVNAHLNGMPIVRNADSNLKQYDLGADLLVAPILTEANAREIALPVGDRWHDYWADDVIHDGGQTHSVQAPLRQIPLYIRSGAIIPLQVDDPETGHGDIGSSGWLTLLVYPGRESSREYYPSPEQAVTLRSRRDGANVSVELGRHSEQYVVRIKEPGSPSNIRLNRSGQESSLEMLGEWSDFDLAKEATYYDDERNYLWVRFSTDQSPARISYSTLP